MKKFVSLLLAALLVLSLTACGSKNNHSGDRPATPTSALNILETVWNTYGEDEKFSVVGGDFSEANLKEDAPGVVAVVDEYVVAVFGAEDLIDTFMTHLNGIYGVHAAYDEAIQ